jgi:hypothetical protein
MFFCKKSRSLTFIAEGYLTRGARRWSWTILNKEADSLRESAFF